MGQQKGARVQADASAQLGLSRRRRMALSVDLVGRAPMREPEPEHLPPGISMNALTMNEFMDLEDSWSARRERV